jgi:hypothetical protein
VLIFLSKGLNIVDVSLPSSEDGNRSNFLNVVFCGHLEYKMMVRVYKPSESEHP